jgi:hypothetical protein
MRPSTSSKVSGHEEFPPHSCGPIDRRDGQNREKVTCGGRLIGYDGDATLFHPQIVSVMPCARAHLSGMAQRHPHADATYRIVPLKDMACGVEVAIPDSNPTMVTGFATEQRAQTWIAEHRRQVERGLLPRRSRFTKSTAR